MNAILERVFSANHLVERRRRRGLPTQLVPCTDTFTAYLHEEMRQTYLNGHDHAAIVTACALIDFCVKDAIYFEQFVAQDCVFSPDEWDQIDRLEFGKAVNLAKTQGLVTKDEHKKLKWLRKHIRNVYMHGQTPPSLKQKDFDGLVEGNLETGEVTVNTVSLHDNIVMQRMMRLVMDRNTCEIVIPLVDRLVRSVSVRSQDILQDWKKRNPSKPTVKQVQRVLAAMQHAGLDADMIVTSDYPVDFNGESDAEHADAENSA